MKKNSLYIAIPTYNRIAELSIQLARLRRVVATNFTVVVFDNASSDGSDSLALDMPSGWCWIKSEKNLGFQGNLIRIFQYAKSLEIDSLLWILSDDDIVESEAIEELCKFAEDNHNMPILVPFMRHDYFGCLSIRPDAKNIRESCPKEQWLELINGTGLISSWIYPLSVIKCNIEDILYKMSSNSFFQFAITARALKIADGYRIFRRPVGFEFINLNWRFNILETFFIDRSAALSAAAKDLEYTGSLLLRHDRVQLKSFMHHMRFWIASNDCQSVEQVCRAVQWAKERGVMSWRDRFHWAILLFLKKNYKFLPEKFKFRIGRSRHSARNSRLIMQYWFSGVLPADLER